MRDFGAEDGSLETLELGNEVSKKKKRKKKRKEKHLLRES